MSVRKFPFINMESIGYTFDNSSRFRSEDNSADINGLLIK